MILAGEIRIYFQTALTTSKSPCTVLEMDSYSSKSWNNTQSYRLRMGNTT